MLMLESSVFYLNQHSLPYRSQYQKFEFLLVIFCNVQNSKLFLENLDLKKPEAKIQKFGTDVYREGYADLNKNRAL